jgi:ABC-type transport system involved in multi-copper enzyme maturation permease subunit
MLARVCSAVVSGIKAFRWRSRSTPPSSAPGNSIGSGPPRRLACFNAWPVVQRELREGARRPVNHRLRLLSAGVGTALFYFLVAGSDKSSLQMGGWLLGGLHALMLGLIFLIVPALTADCIAREKRDGTLGLLFLTPLSASGIVLGKSLALALRAFTLWLAMVPLLAIPFLTGGVTWFDALSALSLEFCAGVLCITAGLLASSLAQERNSAFLLAFLFGAIFLLLFSEFFGLILFIGFRGFAPLTDEGWVDITVSGMAICTGLFDMTGADAWSSMAAFSTILGNIWMELCLAGPPVTILIFLAVSRFAAARLERSWQDKVPSPRRESFIRRYCAPLWRRRFRRKMQRTLDWNPIAWLQQYSWKARLSKWCLCLAFLLIIFVFSNGPNDSGGFVLQTLLLTLTVF